MFLPDIQNYSSFILTVLVFQAIPGAGTVAILHATSHHGMTAGMNAVIGTLMGDCIYMLAAASGLAAIFAAYPGMLTGLQWAGVSYLGLIGLKHLCIHTEARSSSVFGERNNYVYLRQAMTISLTNPKVMLFFVAFFPLFLRENSGPITLLVLMLHVVIISFIFQTGLVLVGNTVTQWLSQRQMARKIGRRMAGAALIGCSVRLALTSF